MWTPIATIVLWINHFHQSLRTVLVDPDVNSGQEKEGWEDAMRQYCRPTRGVRFLHRSKIRNFGHCIRHQRQRAANLFVRGEVR